MSQEDLLIVLVQKFPLLFDKASKDFKDVNKKNNAWKTIANEMSISVEDVQKLWRYLREKFAKERRTLSSTPSGNEVQESSWPLYNAMSFMRKHVSRRKRTFNILKSRSSQISSVSKDAVWDSDQMMTVTSDSESRQIAVKGISDDEVIPSTFLSISASSSTSKVKLKSPNNQSNVPDPITQSHESIHSNNVDCHISDKNVIFGQFVASSLAEMSDEEQKLKRLKIVEILNAHFVE
ncbi:transcription factor Adf-1-like [Euwallacea similis]|uniref:transcription factor Adf-1-like n=1 Tax=Euwallacea similis TaxID=1736056 RepID=UPI00344FA764